MDVAERMVTRLPHLRASQNWALWTREGETQHSQREGWIRGSDTHLKEDKKSPWPEVRRGWISEEPGQLSSSCPGEKGELHQGENPTPEGHFGRSTHFYRQQPYAPYHLLTGALSLVLLTLKLSFPICIPRYT